MLNKFKLFFSFLFVKYDQASVMSELQLLKDKYEELQKLVTVHDNRIHIMSVKISNASRRTSRY
jgi:hypothetical protein